ncbi:hypothetical protein [Mucilaginibacter aquaedulcis]|uniref:hypothetical protein n=1 Tax=Mucilaginibacter aquaedulcis TaxID=1187081 RepID=UPI0025B4B10B|nr:hypothetical protein [Mucilaginibacter aquaedulcis]MDN3546753.1 hypothetical protein [Mucilaginibacter aquaedulcis]
MNTIIKQPKILNNSFTKRIIALQNSGYDHDFLINSNGLLCLQNNHNFPACSISLTVIDQVYDALESCFKYIHLIETCNGEKGILVANCILTRQSAFWKFQHRGTSIIKDIKILKRELSL